MADHLIVLVAATVLGLALAWLNLHTGRSMAPSARFLKTATFLGVVLTFGVALVALGQMGLQVLA